MAKANKIIFPILRLFSIFLALLCLLALHQANGSKCDFILANRILGGKEAHRCNWPFIAALYLAKKSKYFCGGTLVSSKTILTAAHCIWDKGASRPLLPGDIEVRLGAYDLSTGEEDDVKINVSKIYLHPDWDVYADRYDADVGILVLSDIVNFRENIRPISMPTDGVVVDPSATIDITGTIVGLGLSETTNHEDIPREAVISVYNNSHCFLTHKGFADLSSHRTFCAGSVEGSPGKGDSGGGFFVFESDWAQYGIISSILTNSKGNVVRSLVAVYTNVQLFRSWILNKIEESGGSSINLHCTYKTSAFGYMCALHDLDIRSNNIEIASFTGSHVVGKTDEYVNAISFTNGTMFFLPNGIGNFFMNLTILVVERGLGTKSITRSNFQNLDKLKVLHVKGNDIEVLPFDTLWDLPALTFFSFIENRLNVLDERTFERNERLTHFGVGGNRLKFLPRNLFKNNVLLQRVNLSANALEDIEIDFTALKKLEDVYLYYNHCINTSFTTNLNNSQEVDSLTELQRTITANCNSIN